MYQIKFSGGYEVVVIGRGESGLCRVVRSASGQQAEMLSGTYAECEKWLHDRGLNQIAGDTAASIATERGR